MSPQIPIFESKTKAAELPMSGPSTLVDANSFGVEGRQQAEAIGQQGRLEAAAWGQVGEAGTKLETMGVHFAKVGQHLQHAQDVAAVSKAVGQSYLQLGEDKIKAQSDPKYINVTDPNTGATRAKNWQEMAATATERVNVIKSQLAQGLSPGGQQLFDEHYDRLAAQHIVHVTGEAQKRQVQAIAGDFQGAVTDAVQAVALGNAPPETLDQVFAAAQSTGVINPKEIARLKKDSYNKIDITRGQLMAQNDPNGFIAQLKDTTFLPTVIGTQRKSMESYAFQEKNRQQGLLWDDLQKGMANGQVPTQDQVNSLSGAHQLTVKHLLKSMANEDSKPALVDIGNRVIQLKSNDAPTTMTEGKKLYDDIASNPNLSSSTKLSFMNTVQTKMNGAQLNASKFQDQHIVDMQKMMSPAQAGLFGIDYMTEPGGIKSLPDNATTADTAKHINNFAWTYVRASRDHFLEQAAGKKKKGGNMEEDAAKALFPGGGGGKAASPAGETQGYRVFNNRTKQYENVTKDQFDMIKGK